MLRLDEEHDPTGMIDAVRGVGFPPLTELWQKIKDARVPIYV